MLKSGLTCKTSTIKAMIKLPDHLGGHKGRTHIDEGVLDMFWHNYKCRSMIDVGCGPGGQVHLAITKGWEANGVDGDYTIARRFDCEIFDFSMGVYNPSRRYDLGWCVEFLEHVDEQYVDNYMPALSASKYLVVTHALPGEEGHHHVNCQHSDYWIGLFDEYGLVYDDDLTKEIRSASTMERDFIRRRGLAFVNAR